ncbi:MAG: hypothetical protein WD267_08715 [Balneolales bacterium]
MRILLTISSICLLILSCSFTKEVQSNYTDQPVQVEGLLSQWPTGGQSRIQTDNLDYYLANNSEFLFLRIDFKSQKVFEEAKRFGFTVYFDNAEKVKRSLGITYPAGIVTQLSEIPGGQKDYFENPGWESIPQNKSLYESLEKNLSQQALLMQRNDKKASIRPFLISLNQLRAQGIELELDQSSRNMSVVMKVPLESTRFHQFALDTKPGQVFNLGFEVKSPSIDEIDPDKEISDESRSQIAYQLPSTYEYWVKVMLANPDVG